MRAAGHNRIVPRYGVAAAPEGQRAMWRLQSARIGGVVDRCSPETAPSSSALRATVSELLERFWTEAPTEPRRELIEVLASSTDADASTIEVSRAQGGTRQLLNRLGQAGVRHATELTLFLDDM